MDWLKHWTQAWQEIGASAIDEALCGKLVDCYSEPHRHYHTMQHLGECFAHLETLRSLAERPAEIAITLWFHDAIYKTRQHDNEERCAKWAHDAVRAAGAQVDAADRIHALILATRHNAVPTGRDAEVLVDIDLSILGADTERFAEYEAQVRKEYSWVVGPLYRRGRRKVLEEFNGRPAIYSTAAFRTEREAQARANIARSLAAL